jgi:hypothetical protein
MQSPILLVRMGHLLGIMWPGHEFDHIPPSRAEVKNEWNCASTPTYVYMVCPRTSITRFNSRAHTHTYIHICNTQIT